MLEDKWVGGFLEGSEVNGRIDVVGIEVVGACGATPVEHPLLPILTLRGRVNLSVKIFLEEAECDLHMREPLTMS